MVMTEPRLTAAIKSCSMSSRCADEVIMHGAQWQTKNKPHNQMEDCEVGKESEEIEEVTLSQSLRPKSVAPGRP